MFKHTLALLALAGTCCGQTGRPIIITQPGTISGKGTREFQAVTISAGPNFSTNG